MADDNEQILILVRDLMFSSKIIAEARAAGMTWRVIRDPATLAADTPGRMLLADLNQQGVTEAAAGWRAATGRPVVGFASHVDHATLADATARGLSKVLSRGGFVAMLPQLLRGG